MTCPHGMPKPANCIECMEDGPLIPEVMPAGEWAGVAEGDRAAGVLGGPVRAWFASDCPECGCLIGEGDEIVPVEAGGPFVHPECAA